MLATKARLAVIECQTGAKSRERLVEVTRARNLRAMFDAIARMIDPRTGKPYSFGLDGTNDFSQRPWSTIDPTASLQTGGDADPNVTSLAGLGFSPEFLQQIGYTGGDPMNYRVGEGDNQSVGVDPAFIQYLQNQGISLARNTRPGDNGGIGQIQLGAFNADGSQRALSEWNDDPDNQFGAGILGAATFGIGSVLGAGGAAAGSAGAGGGGGGLSAEQLAYGALENGAAYGGGAGAPMVASSEAGFGGALGGEAAAGYGSGAAADAAGMSLAEGAYPAGVTAGGSGGFLNTLGSAASSATDWAKSNPGLTNALGGALNTGIGYLASQNALSAQKDATNQANALWQPYRDLGNTAVAGYSNLLKSPNSVMSDPGVAFARDQGQQAIDRRAAAAGGMYSGAQFKQASRYNTDYASTSLDKALQRYGNAAQLGATGTNATANNVTNYGNAAGSASLYTGNIAQNGVNQGLAQLNGSTYGANDPEYQKYLKWKSGS